MLLLFNLGDPGVYILNISLYPLLIKKKSARTSKSKTHKVTYIIYILVFKFVEVDFDFLKIILYQ